MIWQKFDLFLAKITENFGHFWHDFDVALKFEERFDIR